MAEKLSASISLDRRRTIGTISPNIFGGFIEHMGRCVYEGIYEPGSPHSDADGIRIDVRNALRDMGVTIMRYPGGNFLSGYEWTDGIGPKDKRPKKRDLAWKSTETNQFGTHEFMDYCAYLGSEPMLGVNLGTGTIQSAGNYVEYVNAPTGTYWSDMRAANGRKEPWGVTWWCLGNEMDGPWQIGHLNADDYGKKAREAAKMMKWHDPSIKLVLAGSSSNDMPTYPTWDRTILEHCYDLVDVLSMHYYAINHKNDTPSFLALAVDFEAYIETLASTIRYVKALKRSDKMVKLSWDEWNVWYKARLDSDMDGSWNERPHLIEEVYNLEDALVVSQWMNVFLRKCDVLEIACMAQMVNVIAPILTKKDAMLLQSIYYAFKMHATRAKGVSLDSFVSVATSNTTKFGEVPLLDVSASWDAASNTGACFVVNRSLDQSITVTIAYADGQGAVTAVCAESIYGTDPKAHNTYENPGVVTSREIPVQSSAQGITITLPPLSSTAIDMRG